MNVRLKKTLSIISIGFLLFFVTQLASGVYSSSEILDNETLPEFNYGEDKFISTIEPKIYSEQDKLCVRCHYRDADRITAKGHVDLNCTDCHTELAYMTEYERHDDDLQSAVKSCLDCHEDYDKNHDNIHKNIDFSNLKDENATKPSCLDCHENHLTDVAKSYNSTINKCTKCHDDIYTDFTLSRHYSAIREKNPDAPNCLKCHDLKTGLDETKTLLLCTKCHLDPEVFHKGKINTVSGYFTEFHGRHALGMIQENEAIETLECKDCHDVHKANKLNYMQNQKCCTNKDCHDGVSDDFHKAMTPHGRSNIKSDTNFAAWFFNLLGMIVLSGCIFFALIDNLISAIRFKPDKEKTSQN